MRRADDGGGGGDRNYSMSRPLLGAIYVMRESPMAEDWAQTMHTDWFCRNKRV